MNTSKLLLSQTAKAHVIAQHLVYCADAIVTHKVLFSLTSELTVEHLDRRYRLALQCINGALLLDLLSGKVNPDGFPKGEFNHNEFTADNINQLIHNKITQTSTEISLLCEDLVRQKQTNRHACDQTLNKITKNNAAPNKHIHHID